jgi:signal transduction histidine kinase
VVDLLKAHADQRNHDVVVDIDTPDLMLDTDVRKLEQILSNLFSNAIKYTPKGGHIRVVATVTDDAVSFLVADSGNGIPETVRKELFEAYSAEAAPGVDSVGLGLWICQTFTEALGGAITVDETSEKGTTFHVRFPRTAITPAAVA